MSKIDQKYIDALQNFTDALDAIVDVLQQQQKTGKADVVNELFKAPTNELTKVVKDLKKVTQKGFTDLKSDNAKILKKIDSIKQQKESGMFDKIEDGKNKNKIVDGIKVVILIAAGVLALGMAFKIVGKVDFLSVIALSVAMVAMAYAYKQIAEIKGLTYYKVFMVALALPIMSMGLLASGWILRNFPVIGIMQGLSMILVGASVGVAAYFLLRSVSKINIKKDWATILLLPQILPLIAMGLLSAAWILKNFPIFGFLQSLSLILVSAALGIAAYLLLSGLGKIDIRKNWATILLLPMILPLIALGIVLASKVLQNYMPLKHPWKLLIDSLVLGLSVLFFVPSVLLLGMFIKDYKQLSIGILGAIAVAGAIVAIAEIFKLLPTTFVTPPLMWSLKTGLSLLMFSAVALLIAVVLGANLSFSYDTGKGISSVSGTAGGKFENLAVGVLGLIAVAGSIVAISHILTLFKSGPGIPMKWTMNVGISMMVFSASLLLITILMNSTLSVNYDFGKNGKASLSGSIKGDLKTLGKGFLAMIGMSVTLVAISQILKFMDNSTRIDPEWSLNVGLTLLGFGAASFLIGIIVQKNVTALPYGLIAVVGIAAAILAVDFIIRQGQYKDYPKTDWMLGVGLAIVGFGAVAVLIGSFGVASLVAIGFGLAGILLITGGILAVDLIIRQGKYQDYPKMDWIKGVGLSLASFGAIAVLSAPFLGLILVGSLSMLAMAGTMLAIDKIFNSSSFTKYPSEEWAKGVAKSMALFTSFGGDGKEKGMLGTIWGAVKGVVRGVGGAAVGATMIPLAMAMVQVDNILSKGKFTTYPDLKWVSGVGMALSLFTTRSLLLGPFIQKYLDMSGLITRLSINMVSVALLFNAIDWNAMKMPTTLYMDNYQYFLSKIYEIYQSIDASVNLGQLTLFSINASNALFFTSSILNNGKYDNFPSREYIDNFAYFIIVISDTVRRANFDVGASLVFLQATMNVVPSVNYWIQMISKGDFTKVPTFAYSDRFAYYVYIIGMVVKNWGPTVEQSVNFHSSIRFIVPAITSFTTIPLMDAKFTQSLGYIKQGLISTASGIYDFNSYGLSLKDFETFEFSMRFVSKAVDTFTKLPIVDMKFLSSMITMRLALSQLVGAVNSFLYEDYEVSLLFGALKIKGKKKKDLSDYISFSNFVRTIAFGLKTLGELKPIPENAINSFSKFLQYLDKMPKDVFNLNDKADGIKKLADSLMNLATSLNTLNKSLTGFLDMSKGLYLISIIDDAKLGNVLKSIEQHQSALRIVYKVPEEQANLLSVIKSLYETLPGTGIEAKQNKEIAGKIEAKDIENKKQEQFYQDISEIKSLLYQFLEYSDRPQQGASVHK